MRSDLQEGWDPVIGFNIPLTVTSDLWAFMLITLLHSIGASDGVISIEKSLLRAVVSVLTEVLE